MNDIIEFFTDPLRLTLLVAGVVVVLGIIIFGRRSQRMDARLYHGHSNRDFEFNNPPPDLLVDEEVIVLPPRSKRSDEATAAASQEEIKVESFSASDEATAEESTISEKLDVRQVEGLEEGMPMATFEYPQDKSASEKDEESVAQEPVQAEDQPKPKQAAPAPERFIVFHVIPSGKETFNGNDISQVASALGLAYGKHNVFHFPADNAREGDSQFCLVNMTSEGSFDKENLASLETRGVSLILRLTEESTDGLTLFSNMLAIAQGMARRLGGEIQDQTRVPLTPEIVTSLRSDIAKFHTQLNKRTPVTEI